MGSIGHTSRIDHVTILLSKEEFDNPPSWLSDNFTIIEGGKHTGQASQLKLIVFEDGTYLELFNWWDEPPKDHSWGTKEPGLIDWSISTTSMQTQQEHYDGIEQRINSATGGDGYLGVSYPPPSGQGRTTPQGTKLHWTRTNPVFHSSRETPDDEFFPTGRLDAPFLCYDGTPRNTRLRFDDPARTTHPCGAVGMSQIEVVAPSSHMANYLTLLTNFLGSQPQKAEGNAGHVFSLGRPVEDGGECSIWLHEERDEADETWLRTRGIGPLKLRLQTKDHKKRGEKLLGSDGSASHVSLVC
ncbi:Uncharacterized protein PECH_004807 [Penicillium ucsense]|uniref:Glyoxalase-like domain-containing protein n=1 Tax=Penicillium ucsense TaxID=2839758 RepID=A0A8J8W9K1_9EURO|nr:Uncharacterized protein PECM_007557 [Penicillium ucsense]KAF7739323.1 Uncharacterized protein PECH_004807 [Penicillium ucsense]